MKSTKRICLWSGPRNISTALMYSFGNRADTAVIDEPFYGYYLKNSDAASYHPSAEEIMESMECDAEVIIDKLLAFDKKPIYFIKNMPHHIPKAPVSFLKSFEHIILLRRPEAMVRSFSKVIQKPNIRDFGYLDQLKLVEELHLNKIPFVLLESESVIHEPKERLNLLCSDLNIPFSEKMLSWPKGAREEDGIWAKHWYTNVHQSTGFKPSTKNTQGKLEQEKRKLVDELNKIYGKIKALSC